MTDEQFHKRILDNVTVYLDRAMTLREFAGDRETTVAAYLAEVETLSRMGGFSMTGMQIIGLGQTPENPYGRAGITAAEGEFLGEIGTTLRGFMFAGSPNYDEAWCTRFNKFIADRVDKERTAFWEKILAERTALGLLLDEAEEPLPPETNEPLSEGAWTILRACAAGPLTAEEEHWVSGPICTELVDRGLCTAETVKNPDGTPGGGAYYRILPKGQQFFDRHTSP